MSETTRNHRIFAIWPGLVGVFMLALLLTPATVGAEEGLTGKVSLTYLKNTDGDRELRAKVLVTRDAEEGEFPVENMTVQFFADAEEISEPAVAEAGEDGEDAEEAAPAEPLVEMKPALLGEAVTDADGVALYVVKGDEKIAQTADHMVAFEARPVFEGLEDVKGRVSVQEAEIELGLDEEEGLVMATVRKVSGDEIEPVAYASVEYYVLRTFGDIGFHGDFTMTDDDGLVGEEFPDGIPGDEAGVVQVMVRIQGQEQLGRTEKLIDVPWGIARAPLERDRALWAGRDSAPWWLIWTVNTLLVAWAAAIVYLLWSLVGIRRAGGRREA